MHYIVGISIALFVVALLLNKKGKSTSDKILALWMLVCAIHLGSQYAYVEGYMLDFPFLFGIAITIPLTHGVFLFFYVASVTDQLPQSKVSTYLHFIPIALSYLYLIIYFFPLPTDEKAALIESKGEGHELFNIAMLGATMISGVVYVIWSIILLRRHEKNILDRFSRLENINLRWLQFLIFGLALVWAVVIFAQKDEYIFIGVVLFVILTGFFGIQQVDIYSHRTKRDLKIKAETSVIQNDEKYASSGLTKKTSVALYGQLIDQMENKKVYKQQELSISELAAKLDTHPNYLSQVINDNGGKKFFDFINGYRVEEFKKLVADPKNKKFTILSLAYDCGFNSKSSFNRYFKKATGLTPSQYINSSSTG